MSQMKTDPDVWKELTYLLDEIQKLRSRVSKLENQNTKEKEGSLK